MKGIQCRDLSMDRDDSVSWKMVTRKRGNTNFLSYPIYGFSPTCVFKH